MRRRRLPRRRSLGELLAAGVGRLSLLLTRFEAAWREPRVPRIALPAAQTSTTIGRAHDCDWLLQDATVSRRHARLRRRGEAWLLCDLGSLNGTRVNGRRVVEEVEVRPGDRVSFGAARYRFAEPQS
jgi:FHA domain